jgi:hypothetical protein
MLFALRQHRFPRLRSLASQNRSPTTSCSGHRARKGHTSAAPVLRFRCSRCEGVWTPMLDAASTVVALTDHETRVTFSGEMG